jgi:hypothetical protein
MPLDHPAGRIVTGIFSGWRHRRVVWKGDAAGVVLQLSEVHSGFSITATSASIFLGEGLGLFGRLGCQTAVQIIPRGVGFVLEPIGALRPEFCKKAQLVGDQLSL